MVTRAPPAWAGPYDGRRLTNEQALLAACGRSSSGLRCEPIDFGGGVGARAPFAEAVRRVRAAWALVGVHGAGLANAIFLRPSASEQSAR